MEHLECLSAHYSVNVVGKDKTTIIGGKGKKADVKARADEIRAAIENTKSDYDKKKLDKIANYKADGGNFSFGARTPYGSIIGPACEKFGWSLDYVVWGIGYTNLKMLLADAQVSVYLSEEDRKKLKISPDREIIDANDPANIERIRQILKGN